MFRQTLDAGSAYAGVGAHGSGMTALQFRRERGANTEDIELNIDLPKTLRIEKHGDTFTLFVSNGGEPLHPVGASASFHLTDPFYVGIGAVSHDIDTTDTVRFSHVTLEPLSPGRIAKATVLYSTLRTLQTEDQFRRAAIIRSAPVFMQSANWVPAAKSVYVHEDGHVQKIAHLDPPGGGPPSRIPLGALVDCSGNFGVSPDGRWLAVSCAETRHGRHDVYVLPAAGGTMPRKLTTATESSFFHAWSPDSRMIAFTRGSASKADIFTISAQGGTESRLTRDTLNDGPDFTPDGRWIYFDSSRSGAIQIWRMQPDGSAAEQVTDDDKDNSSPHVSPDGKNLAFLTQPRGAGSGIGDAAIRIMSFNDGLIRTLTDFQGDRGSFSMYGWGDANHLAFISYQMLPGAPSLAGAAGTSASAPSSPSNPPRPPITGVSHIAVYAADPAKSEQFYAGDLGAVKRQDVDNPAAARYYFAPAQFVEVLPLPPGQASINRLDHVAFVTADAEKLRVYLAAQKIQVPEKVTQGRDGTKWLGVTDPEGNRIEFVQNPAHSPSLPVNPLSHRIIHVGFIIHDRALEDAFYRSVLGFKPYWFGGMHDDTPTWISLQVPDGSDWLEYMIVGTPQGRGIPADMNPSDLGVLNHFSLGVPDTRAAYTLLWNNARLTGPTNTPRSAAMRNGS